MAKYPSLLIASTYHLKNGCEDNFIKLWNHRMKKFAYLSGVISIGIYHNADSDEYRTLSYWRSREDADRFLNSKEFLRITEKLNAFCLVPSKKEHFEYFLERVA